MRMGRSLGAALLCFATFSIATATPKAAAAAAPDGKAIFLAQKCNLCHSVSAAGIERTRFIATTSPADVRRRR